MLNGLEKTLERKVPERDRRWELSEDMADYLPRNKFFIQGWPDNVGLIHAKDPISGDT